ncbi:hypothetical protein [Acinetobacter sp. B51(2017)]|uniref:hypothetical protein n=1 Tax=Acinetobacter sp. B51(2017) TaxID=2060938 RepID=UPI000F082E42|nr:hypothetical protein [Acinetobacter sp. B51(2017)]
MSYTPPEAHSVNLNFDTPLSPIDSHNLVLNFGELGVKPNVLKAPISTAFKATISGTNTQSKVNWGQLHTSIKTGFLTQISGTNYEQVDNRGVLRARFDLSFLSNITATNDINHLVGVSLGLSHCYQKAKACLSEINLPWSKPILRASNEALFYDPSLSLSQQVAIDFENGLTLSRAVQAIHEQSIGLSSSIYLDWQTPETRFIHQCYVHDEGLRLIHQRQTAWQEMLRRRKTLSYAHEVAEQLTHCFSFAYDLGLEVITKTQINWDQTKAIHYRKHKIKPWPTPEKPKYVGGTDLNFTCLCATDSLNLVLNFGAEDCIPALAKKQWWYVLNHLHAERLDTGEKIIVLGGSYSCSRDTWCWSHSITVAHTEKAKLQPTDNQPVILKLMINSFEHHVLLETDRETIKFADRTYTYSGRSVTALNSSDYAAKRSFIQDNDRTSVQLVQAELDRALANTQLDWQLIDDVGWPVSAQSLSYTELAPMDAIKQVVESGGGFIYSQKSGNQLSILPKYKKGHWDVLNAADYDILISESAVLEQTIEKNPEYLADYNAVTLVNSRSGDDWKIKQRNSAGDIPFETTVGPMFDVMSAQSNGKMQLIQANVQEIHTFSGLPITNELGEMLPGKTIAFGGQWWGVIDSVSGSYSHSEATETIKVERIHRD